MPHEGLPMLMVVRQSAARVAPFHTGMYPLARRSVVEKA